MPNQPIDAVGADPVKTDPTVEATFPKIADLIPARFRRWGYAIGGAWSTFVGAWVIEGEPPSWAGWVTIGLLSTGFGVAVANVPRKVTP